MAVARSSSGGIVISDVLPVLWMMSLLAVMGRMAMHAIYVATLGRSMNVLLCQFHGQFNTKTENSLKTSEMWFKFAAACKLQRLLCCSFFNLGRYIPE